MCWSSYVGMPGGILKLRPAYQWGRWIGFGSRCGSSVFWSGTGETQCQESGERMFWMGGGDVEVDSRASVGYTWGILDFA